MGTYEQTVRSSLRRPLSVNMAPSATAVIATKARSTFSDNEASRTTVSNLLLTPSSFRYACLRPT